jgi:hypothetical protein
MGRVVRYDRNRGQNHGRRMLTLLATGAGLGVVLGYASLEIAPPSPLVSGSTACRIKGNISVDTGERIYHVPGQRYYTETIISPLKGERWFCSEAEARAAGWRKSKI